MRLMVDSGSARDASPAERDRHVEMLSRFIERLAAEPQQQSRGLSLILRSAASPAAQAVIRLTVPLGNAAVAARVVLARLEPAEDLHQLFASLSELSPRQPSNELIRWARNARLLDAHEQVIYGNEMCWSGDPMRRDPNKRNALSLFDEKAGDAVRHGRLAFEALWLASVRIPQRHLLGQARSRPSGAYQAAEPSTMPVSLRPSLEAWPLIRH